MSFSLGYWISRWEDKNRGRGFSSLGSYGILRAQQILKHYDLIGLLFGSVAKAVWKGSLNEISIDNSKDTDVLVLNRGAKQLPEEREGGIDWFCYRKEDEKPSNQMMHPDFAIELINPGIYHSGLYLLHWSILQQIDRYLLEDRDGFPLPLKMVKPLFGLVLEQPPKNLPVIDPADLKITFSLGGQRRGDINYPNFIEAGICKCNGWF